MKKQEALKRLAELEKVFGLNPNVKKYFGEGKLYYSYITGGGFMGSIDTIAYDARYKQLAADFEQKKNALVYHAIEGKNSLALLFVGSENDWEKEMPKREAVYAWVYDFGKQEGKFGYIKVDVLQGALYMKNEMVYDEADVFTKKSNVDEKIKTEVVERLNILVDQGIITDLDIIDIYSRTGEIFVSQLMMLGEPCGIVMKLSQCLKCKKIVEHIEKQLDVVPYFCMYTAIGDINKLAILILAPKPEMWEREKILLEMQCPQAIVVDLNTMSAEFDEIEYELANGGPIYLP